MGEAKGSLGVLALTGLTLGVLLLAGLSMGSAKATAPVAVAPSLSDPMVQSTLSYAKPTVSVNQQGMNAYIQTDLLTQTFRLKTHYTGSVYDAANTTSNVVNVTGLLPGSLYTSGQMWLNTSMICQRTPTGSCPYNATIRCDGMSMVGYNSPPAFALSRPCSTFALLFPNPTVLSIPPPNYLPTYILTRAVSYVDRQSSQWFLTGSTHETMSANLTITKLSSFSAANATSYSIPAACWALPYPAGQWNPAVTQVAYTNGTPATVALFLQVNNSIVLRWSSIPAGVQNLTISVYGTPGTTSSGYGNGSLPSVITLAAYNTTADFSGNDTSTALWTNGLGLNYSGGFLITGTWVATATHVQSFLNGQPIASMNVGSGISIAAGTVNVTNGSQAAFSVRYEPASTFSTVAPSLFFNGVPVSTVTMVLIAGGVASAAVVFITRSTRFARIKAVGSIALGLFLMFGVADLWLSGV